MSSAPVFFFTDFSTRGPYTGQMEAALLSASPDSRVINLMCDAPFADPKAAAYLLSALDAYLPKEAIVVAVVDPGVGGDRKALCLNKGERWYTGPDNGLLAVLATHSKKDQIVLRELDMDDYQSISASFHGRDVFAPVAGILAQGKMPPCRPFSVVDMVGASWPADLSQVIYSDGFGNAMTGIRAANIEKLRGVVVEGQRIDVARTFSSVPPGELFCYENSIGLIEIAVSRGSASRLLGLNVGAPVRLLD
ncbi:MAG TPA: hypothetical protein EYP34_02200 [Chromatiaceae bacterium]|nr:hypothetical protein [Chromatiaceae bacterium]